MSVKNKLQTTEIKCHLCSMCTSSSWCSFTPKCILYMIIPF